MLIRLFTVSLARCSFSFFVCTDLRLHRFPVHLQIFRELTELVMSLLAIVHLQETLTVGDDCVDVSLVLNRDFKSALPFVHLYVQLYCAVVQTSLKQNLLCFRDLLLVNCKRCIA